MAAFAGAQAGQSHTSREQNRPDENLIKIQLIATCYVGRFIDPLVLRNNSVSGQRVAQVRAGAPDTALGPGGTKCVSNARKTSEGHISYVWAGALVPLGPWPTLLLQFRRPTERYLAASSRKEPQRISKHFFFIFGTISSLCPCAANLICG